jgi:hypothetical protein
MWPTLSNKAFLLLGLAALIFSRLLVIGLTPRTADFPDPRIYQGTGQVVLAGINPYDYSDQPQLREELRLRMAAIETDNSFAYSMDAWNYYVSGNLPASVALYAAFEYVARGSRPTWRLLLILGDVAMFLGMFALFRTIQGGSLDKYTQIAAFWLVIANPSLVLSGTAVPEDKQFQTALMLFAAAFLLSPKPTNALRGLAGGLLISASVLFKFFGAFLLPLWFMRAIREWPKFAVSTAAGALVPILASFMAFGPQFLSAMSARAVRDSVQGPMHASPWMLFPALTGGVYIAAKLVVVAGFGTFLVTLLAKRRIDLLNCCAGFAVVFACIWLDMGSMNRMNMAIIFAIAATASLSPRVLLALSASTAFVAAVGYVVGLGLLRVNFEKVDVVLVLLFLMLYAAALVLYDRSKFREKS